MKETKKDVLFILPGPRRESVGGYKIVYQYGDYLNKCGIQTDFFYLTNNEVCGSRFYGFKGLLKTFFFKLIGFYKWFDFESNRANHIIKKKADNIFEQYNIIICTSIESFIYIKKNNPQERFSYFVQDYENWKLDDSEVNKTYSYDDVDYVTITKNLKQKIENQGGSVSLLVNNGISSETFKITHAWIERSKSSFCFMYHPSERKGCSLLINFFQIMKERGEKFTVECFSVYDKPKEFPSFIKYNYRPSASELNSIYNNNRYFVCTSIYEGFGLTPAEAAFSGCLILSTKNGGVEEYIDKTTGILFERRELNCFDSTIKTIMHNEDVYGSLALNGHEVVTGNLNLEKSKVAFLAWIKNKIRGNP